MSNAYFDQVALLRRLHMSADHASKNLKDFAGLGSSGRYPGNIKRDLIATLGDPQVPLPHFEEVPMIASKGVAGDQVQEVDFPIMLPHEVFAHMYTTHPKRFANLFQDILG
jgi:hypothetical protein